MSKFECPAVRIVAIHPIEGADKIEMAQVGDYRSVVPKGNFQPNYLAVYMPEGAIVPGYLLEKTGLVGKLAGKNKDRIKPARLKGCLSQGILLRPEWTPGSAGHVPVPGYYNEQGEFKELHSAGEDFSEFLGIIKYEPPIPTQMNGQVAFVGGNLLKFDVENYKKFPDVFQEGELVEFTEKTHGTFTGLARFEKPIHPELHGGGIYAAFSKGLGGQGMAFKDVPENSGNLYVQSLLKYKDHLDRLFGILSDLEPIDFVVKPNEPGYVRPADREVAAIYVLGETYGHGVQGNFNYGRMDKDLAVFDIYVRYTDGNGRYLNFETRNALCQQVGIPTVPSLYVGPFSKKLMLEHTDGKTVIGGGAHIREGIVIRAAEEVDVPELGRKMLKSVSAAYLDKSTGEEVQ